MTLQFIWGQALAFLAAVLAFTFLFSPKANRLYHLAGVFYILIFCITLTLGYLHDSNP